MPLKHYRFEMFANASRRVQACATGMGQARQYFCLRTCPRRWRKGRSVAHQGGQGRNKHKGVEDFVAAVAQLSELGYSRPQRTALISGSAGGLLLGNALVHYLDKFGAAVLAVAFLNPVRMAEEPNGANQFGEMGDPRKASDFPWILAMEPTPAYGLFGSAPTTEGTACSSR